MIFHDFFIIFGQKKMYFFAKSRFSQGQKTQNDISIRNAYQWSKFKLWRDLNIGKISHESLIRFTGEMGFQIKDMPDGEKISFDI